MDNKNSYFALMGNPNSGKTAIFNILTGMDQKVSNYPGITVEKKKGIANISSTKSIEIMDFPGAYSMLPESLDESIVANQVFDWMHNTNIPQAIILVIDATNLSRNLYFTTQLLELNIPVILVLNMMDRLKVRKKNIDSVALKKILGVAAVVPMSARKKWGIEELKSALNSLDEKNNFNSELKWNIPAKIQENLKPVKDFIQNYCGYNERLALGQSIRLITKHSSLDYYKDVNILSEKDYEKLKKICIETTRKIRENGISPSVLEATFRYDMIDRVLGNNLIQENIQLISRSEKVDMVLTHPYFGIIFFISMLYIIFQSIFTFATIPMDWINSIIGSFGNFLVGVLPEGILRSLLIDGVIAGVGSVIIFLPQILILMFFLLLLEDSGYMARVAFMMDKIMNKMGLHGKSVLPLMSGYACAIPGIMSTRTIDNWKERLVTILVLPLISCAARLPVYALMISAFVPSKRIILFFNLQGLVMVFMYFLGTITAILIAALISRFIKEKNSTSFIMELPPYRMPLARSVFHQLFIRGKLFIIDAGKIIMAISILLWFLASFPTNNSNGNPTTIHESYAGRIGHAIEPIIAPLGFDWKIGVGLITSFAAREVMVSTLATLYNIEGEDEVIGIKEALQNDINPSTGLPNYTPLIAISIMVFYVYAAQCMATFAIVKSETNSWKWPIYMIVYMTSLAYLGSFMVYQGGLLLGYS